MPQPFLGFSLQSLPLAGIAHLSRGHIAPLRLSTDVLERRLPDLVTVGFADTHAFTQLPGSSRQLWAPFPHTEVRFPFALDLGDEAVPFGQLHPLRSLDPPANPSAPARVASGQHVASLLGFCLSRAFSSHASGSQPAWVTRTHACTFRPKTQAHDPKDFDTPRAG
jgi:hypothetical protein